MHINMSPGSSIWRTELHKQYGGRRQGGISPSAQSPNVFLITAASGEAYGYLYDGWADDGLFHYTGEGQTGDQRLTQGNRVLDAAVRWERMGRNPAKVAGRNPKPPPRAVRAFARGEVDALSAELSAMYAPLPAFAAATGLRPEEWQALERRDLDRRGGVVYVRRTVSSGEVMELAKTSASRRQVPLSRRALAALDGLPPRIDTPRLFPAPSGGLMCLDNFRRREWSPAVDASRVARPARIYDLRSTFASNAIAAGVSVFVLARVMGTSIEMIERHYGTLLDGATADVAGRLDAHDAEQDRATDEHSDERLGH